MKLLLMCGGPSKERDISLNSVRSVFDHLRTMPNIELKVIFVDENMNKYKIDEKFLYSNTASDFEFMLNENEKINNDDFNELLKAVDMVFPVMHGKYGEDGQIQSFLENRGIPFVASPSEACRKMYNKRNADNLILKPNGLRTIPKLFIDEHSDIENEVSNFMNENLFSEVIIKPVQGGSSIGVSIAHSIEDAVLQSKKSFQIYGELVIEEVCKGKEFTVIILESNGVVAALLPTEIELLDKNAEHTDGEIFDKRKKYLSTTETHYYCPARFEKSKIDFIRSTAKMLFEYCNAHDFLRIDGWLLDDGTVYFSDFNPISGMEQNSFIFQQAAVIGLRHKDLLALILRNACERNGISFDIPDENNGMKQRINLLLGGVTSERQVSLMSGTNSWLKLLNSQKYHPVSYILFQENNEFIVYELPYAAALKHTTEEIYDYLNNRSNEYISYTNQMKDLILDELGIRSVARAKIIEPEKQTLLQFINMTKEQNADIFLGLHGGFGENGSLQELLENAGIHFNGAGSKAAKLCMDKFETGRVISEASIEGVRTCQKVLMTKSEIESISNYEEIWKNICLKLGVERIIIKPNGDGCSTGIVIIESVEDFDKYLRFIKEKSPYIPENTFTEQPEKIQLPNHIPDMLFEEYIITDKLIITDKSVTSSGKGDWVELTVGVLAKNGEYHSLNPSITVADNAVLSLEEKFQGGTGINITPPPTNIISEAFCEQIKKSMEKVAKLCGIKDYCRIDIFANNKKNEIIVIELNTLPGLSPSTVLFQQGAKELPPLYPMELLETIISK